MTEVVPIKDWRTIDFSAPDMLIPNPNYMPPRPPPPPNPIPLRRDALMTRLSANRQLTTRDEILIRRIACLAAQLEEIEDNWANRRTNKEFDEYKNLLNVLLHTLDRLDPELAPVAKQVLATLEHHRKKSP